MRYPSGIRKVFGGVLNIKPPKSTVDKIALVVSTLLLFALVFVGYNYERIVVSLFEPTIVQGRIVATVELMDRSSSVGGPKPFTSNERVQVEYNNTNKILSLEEPYEGDVRDLVGKSVMVNLWLKGLVSKVTVMD